VYIERLGLSELYAADLDAILGGRSQDEVVSSVASLGTPLWLDAAVSSVDRACHALSLGAAQVVIGLETLGSYTALGDICREVGRDRVAFSLDLRNGKPLTGGIAIAADEPAQTLAARAVDAGVGSVIVIDLGRIGLGAGVDLVLVDRVRRKCPDVMLVAGGGVSGFGDLQQLAGAGCDGALVATALHDGRIGAVETAKATRLKPRRSREA
jgi:phosphoribosylformimino-5-aminoimidazole carboxamide ribotide isomerase